MAMDGKSVQPSFGEALQVWARIGLLSFGGPAGQIALMHRTLVEERRWIDEKSYLEALNFCMLLPGPEAMQLATYVGWKMHGVKGGLAAGLLFVMPGALVVLALSMLYATIGNVPTVVALFTGIKAAVLAIVVEALLRISKRALKTAFDWTIAAAAFLALYVFAVPFPVIILAAAIAGVIATSSAKAPHAPLAPTMPPSASLSATLATIAVWLALWILPLVAITQIFPAQPVFVDIAWFFSKLAVVTFGGAYAVLAYVADEGVQHYGWLQPGEMLDGLGLAETTPGPLILVNSFVGYLAAYRGAGAIDPILAGVIGWAVTLWATFAPCFLWIFAGAPWVERINAEPRLKAALAAITAAVVGVILNLTVWFAIHVLFAQVQTFELGQLVRMELPVWSSLRPAAAGLAILAFVLLLRLHAGVITTLAVCAALALVAAAAGVA